MTLEQAHEVQGWELISLRAENAHLKKQFSALFSGEEKLFRKAIALTLFKFKGYYSYSVRGNDEEGNETKNTGDRCETKMAR